MRLSLATQAGGSAKQRKHRPLVLLRFIVSYIFTIVLLIYFIGLAHVGLQARFAPDDMMNMAGYWSKGWAELLSAQVLFFSSYYRPFGGLFYLPILELAGLNPMPYRIVLLCALTANCLLSYRTAQILTHSRLIALLASVFTSFHASQFALFFNTSQLYDIWCFFFWFAGLNVYLEARKRDYYISNGRLLAIVSLYICALNSKEMAVTFPVALLLYELTHQAPSTSNSRVALLHNLRRQATPIAITGLLTLVYIIGKTAGPDAISSWEGYRPVFSVGKFLRANSHYAAELFYLNIPHIGNTGIVILWLFLLYLAIRLRHPYLLWAFGLLTIGTTPIAFISQRSGPSLYIPAFGYAIFVATILTRIQKVMSKEPLFRWIQCPPSAARSVLALTFIWWYGARMYHIEQTIVRSWSLDQNQTWILIQEMQAIQPSIRKGARILFLDDPFPEWDMLFIAQLVLRDPSAQITLARKTGHPLDTSEIATYDHILRADHARIIEIK